MHSFYVGVERIFKDIARTLDESVPDGPDWHRDLLLQMSAGVPSVRPAVISRKTRYYLGDCRGFRRVVRIMYTFNLKPSRLHELSDNLPECFGAVSDDLEGFDFYLEELARS